MKDLEIIIRNKLLGDSKIKVKEVSETSYKFDIEHELYNKAFILSNNREYGKHMSKQYNSIKGDTSIMIYDKNHQIYSFEFNEGKLTLVKTSKEMNLIILDDFKIKNALFYSLKIAKDISVNEKFKFKFTNNLSRILNLDTDEQYYSTKKSAQEFRNYNDIRHVIDSKLNFDYTN